MGRNDEVYPGSRRKQLETLREACGWRVVKDVSADSFLKWRQKQKLIAKTLNEYLISVSALMNWAERFERIASKPSPARHSGLRAVLTRRSSAEL